MASGAELLSTFRTARERVSRHMEVFEQSSDSNWKEETVTDLLLEHCSPAVKFATFTHGEEAKVGADWLWWWVDARGEAFGMLVQAKRLKDDARKIDFEYAPNKKPKGEQRRRLRKAAAALNVPAVYAMYLGTSAYRGDRYCRYAPFHAEPCFYCEPATISMVPALLTTTDDDRAQPSAAIADSVPLEWMVDPEVQGPVLQDHWGVVDPGLRDFITKPQSGARRIAKWMFARTAQVGRSALQHALAEPDVRHDEQVFTSMPNDRDAFDVSYFQSTLGGLRRRPPDYVERALYGEWVFEPPHPGIRGVAVVQLD